MLHLYTFGENSKQFLVLTQKQADVVNYMQAKFSEAQTIYEQRNGHEWDPTQPLEFNTDHNFPDWIERYNKLTTNLNAQHKARNWIYSILKIDVSTEELDTYLVRR